MLSKIYCAACKGIDVTTVTVEVDISEGISFHLVGLADNAVKESQQRIGSALEKIGYRIPGKKIVINMAPANLRKEGSSFDTAIAIGIISANRQLEFEWAEHFLILGELALDSTLRPISGALPIAHHAARHGFKGCILPKESAKECANVDGITIFGAGNLAEVIEILSAPDNASDKIPLKTSVAKQSHWEYDFAHVKGQELAKKGLEIAAAGNHNLIMTGPPGCGKTFMAKCLPSILPDMQKEEAMETGKIYSIAGLLKSSDGIISQRPFRNPHHSSTLQSLAGSISMPGEISLAHNGVLFLDEIAEFGRAALEILRQPLEDGIVQVCRAGTRVTYPASFMLVAAMNPCPCGHFNDPYIECTCSSSAIMKYAGKLSGPLMDRIDLQLSLQRVSAGEIVGIETSTGETSAQIAKRVQRARDIQAERFKGEDFFTNSRIPPGKLARYCSIGKQEQLLLQKIIAGKGLSARAYSRILKISRTIADLDGEDFISLAHISKAIQFKLNINGI